MLFLDLDGFKQVNDSSATRRATCCSCRSRSGCATACGRGDVVARLGGDEFAVLLDRGRRARPPCEVADADHGGAARALPDRRPGHAHPASASASRSPTRTSATPTSCCATPTSPCTARRRRATAASAALRPGACTSNLVERLQLEADLRRALDARRVRPALPADRRPDDRRDRRRRGAGALAAPDARARAADAVHPARRGERADPSRSARWVLERGLPRRRPRWRGASARTAHDQRQHLGRPARGSDFADDVEAAPRAQRARRRAGSLLEMTESVLLDHTDENLARCSSGSRTWACASRSTTSAPATRRWRYLHRFPVDVLKIDRSFIERMEGGDRDAELVRTIVQLGQGLKLHDDRRRASRARRRSRRSSRSAA